MIFVENSPVTGSSASDIVIGSFGNDTLSGGAGDDIVLDDFGAVLTTNGGWSAGTAYNLDAETAFWYDAGARENPLVADNAVPNMSVAVQGEAGQAAYFTIWVPAGQTLTLDVDAAYGSQGSDGSADTALALYDQGGLLMVNDDAGSPATDVGSQFFNGSVPRDSGLTFTNTTGQGMQVIIKLGQLDPGATDITGPFAASQDMLLHIALTGHAVTSAGPLDSYGVIDGGTGDDLLVGGGGNDIFDTGSGNDTVFGGSGHDTVRRGDGSAVVTAGEGSDTLSYLYVGAGVTIDLATGTATGATIQDRLSGIENFDGSYFADILSGSDAANWIIMRGGDDTAHGMGGNDTLFGDGGFDTLYGGAGDDTIHGGADGDEIHGGTGRDVLYGGDGHDDFHTAGALDFDDIDGGAGYDTLFLDGATGIGVTADFRKGVLTAGAHVYTMTGVEAFHGTALADRIVTAATCYREGDEYFAHAVRAGAGNDSIDVTNMANGRVLAYGEAGDDTIRLRDGVIGDGDRFDGGAGTDTLRLSGLDLTRGGTVGGIVLDLMAGTMTASTGSDAIMGFENLIGAASGETILGTAGVNMLDGEQGDDTLDGRGGDDKLFGGLGNDTLMGGAGLDTLWGEDGNDDLRGHDGDDRLDGGAGADKLAGGLGQDRLTGGTGADVFAFQAGTTANTRSTADTIVDFRQAEGDRIDLRAIDAIAGTGTNDAFTFVGGNAFSGTAGELRAVQAGGRTYLEADVNGDGACDFMVRIDGLHTLAGSDFLL